MVPRDLCPGLTSIAYTSSLFSPSLPLRTRSISTIVTNMIKYVIVRVIIDGTKRPMSRSYINCIHFKNFIIWNTIVVAMVELRMAGLTIPISNSSINTHTEITWSADKIAPDILVWPTAQGNELRPYLGINSIRYQVSMVSETGLCWVSGAQWRQGQGLD